GALTTAVFRRGSAADRSAAVLVPARSASTRRTDRSTSASQGSGSVTEVPSRSKFTSFARWSTATRSVVEACTTATDSAGTRNTVLRIASIRTSSRRSYSDSSIKVVGAAGAILASTDRYTVAGSVECSATSCLATWAGSGGVQTTLLAGARA